MAGRTCHWLEYLSRVVEGPAPGRGKPCVPSRMSDLYRTRCGYAAGKYVMSIRVKCPNGHEFKVKDKYAGQRGYCPYCHAEVHVPAKLTEDEVLDLLGPPPPAEPVGDLPVHQDPKHMRLATDPSSMSGSSLLGSTVLNRGMKTCPKCKKEVRLAYDICPYCRTYFTDLSEISRRLASHCPKCGGEVHHGDHWCPTCGADLRQQPLPPGSKR